MTIADYNNPMCWSHWARVCDNNGIAWESPAHNLVCLFWRAEIRNNNPIGQMPELNPEQYINPLTGNYSGGPLEF